MNKAEFKTPSDVYRGLDLWMVNDKLDDDEIVHQVREFRAKGLWSVIFRTYNGLRSDYPGKDFRHKLGVAIKAARECGLKIVLQAGYMPSAFPGLPDKYTLHRIVPTPVDKLSGGENILLTKDGIAYVDALSTSAINMLDPASTEYYINEVYDRMWAEFSDEFGKTVISVWVDEPRFDNRFCIWTPGLEEEYYDRFGESLTAGIDSLFFNTGEYKKIRYRYYLLLRGRMEKYYFKKVREWCHSHNLTFSGHLMGEELLKNQATQACAVMPFYKYFDIPGIDQLRANHDWYDRPLGDLTLTLKGMLVNVIQVVSAALQAGKEHILCEMYGVTSPGFAFRDMMQLFDFFASHGINHQCMHALFYSLSGFRKRFYPQQFNVYQPFWKEFRVVKDYVARTSAFVSAGQSQVDTLMIHPLETAYMKLRGLIDPSDQSPREEVDMYDELFDNIVMTLCGSNIPFHFGDLSTIESDGRIEDKTFRVGKLAYKRVILPSLEVLNSAAYRLLIDFSNAGGEIIIVGNAPDMLDGEVSELSELLSKPGIVRVNSAAELAELLMTADKGYEYLPDSDSSRTVIHHNADSESHYFMLYSGDCRYEKTGTLSIPGLWTVERYDAESGNVFGYPSSYINGSTKVKTFVAPGGSLLLKFSRTDSVPEIIPNASRSLISIDKFEVKLNDPNVLTLEICSYKTDEMEDFSEEYAVECVTELLKREKYSGRVKLRFRFRSEEIFDDLMLALEEPEKCKLTLNGKEIDMTDCGYYFAKSFRLIKLPKVAVGENVIILERDTKPQVQEKICDDMKHLFELFRAPVGVDLERMHIIGDFSVGTVSLPAQNGLDRISKSFRLMKPKKSEQGVADLTVSGYPFYIGSAVYSTRVDLPDKGEYILRLKDFSGCGAAVSINKHRVGSISRPPYELSCEFAAGENLIEIELFGTLRNAIGPSHKMGIDYCGCHRGVWVRDLLPVSHADTKEWTGDFMLVPFGIGGAEIIG